MASNPCEFHTAFKVTFAQCELPLGPTDTEQSERESEIVF